MSNICLFSNFDAAALQFGPTDKNRKGGKQVPVFLPGGNGEKKRVVIQTPVVAVPFGVTPYQDSNTGAIQSYSIDISFRNMDTDPRVADFLNRMKKLDAVLLQAAVKNSAEWFGKPMKEAVVQEFIRKMVKEHPEGKYPPVMKIKVPVVNGEPACHFFDENQKPVPIDYITKGTTVRMILELTPMWFVNKNFGVTWKLAQAKVESRPRRMDTFAFVTDDDMATDPAPAEAPADTEM